MRHAKIAILVLMSLWLSVAHATAEESRYYTDDNGNTIRETRRVVQRPVTTTEWQDRQQTVYRQELRSESRDTWRTVATPTTEYRWLSRLHGRWNPLAVPYYTHHLVPVTRWETRAHIVQVPSLRAEWVPDTRTVRVPVTTRRMAEEEVITRVAVSGRPTTSGSNQIASRVTPAPLVRPPATVPSYGGVLLQGDPPRTATGWRSSVIK